MPLAPYRRHRADCDHRAKGQNFTLCECPIWCYGDLRGEPFRRALHTSDWNRALRRIQVLEQNPDADALLPSPPARTVAAAVKNYLADAKDRNLRSSTIRSMKNTLDELVKACGQIPLTALDVTRIAAFRAQREVKPRTQRKEIEHLRTFCAFCVDRDWLAKNPAKLVKPPRVNDVGTLPFTSDEIRRLLDACAKLQGALKSDTPHVQARARALILVLVYSGLRIIDVAKLRRGALEKTGHLVLRTTKTGVRVKVLLHQDAVAALRALPAPAGNPEYFFWSGRGDPKHCEYSLWRTVSRVGELANLHAHPHRFRDTFAVELLTNRADIRAVQQLLGHESLRTTEKHYAHFVAAHQQLLDDATSTLDFNRTEPARPLLVHPMKHRRRNAK